jgi:diguanylate cyclase (GGDEF)-like protein/PAS domain S-box-containing protein
VELKKDERLPTKKKTLQSNTLQFKIHETLSKLHPDSDGTLLKNVPIPVFFRSISGEYITFNPAFERFLGKSYPEIVGKSNMDLLPTVWTHKEIESDQQMVLNRVGDRYEWQLEKSMGGMRDVFIDKAPVMDDRDNVIGIVGAISDISTARAKEKELTRNNQRIESLLNALPAAMVLINPKTREISDLNPLAMVMLNYTREQLIGKNCKAHICRGETDQCPLENPSVLSCRTEGAVMDSSGRLIPVLKSTVLTEIDDNSLLLECFLDISQQKALEAQLRDMAEKDFLTGIFNRRHFIETAEKEVSRAKRYKNMISVAMLDIDWFKNINDQFGHAAGDVIIKGVAGICQESLRDTDIIGRIGGEEFAALLIESSLEDSLIVAKRLKKNIESHAFRFEDKEIRCTISIGISGLIPEEDTLEAIMKRTDAALYEAKKAGRNQICQG